MGDGVNMSRAITIKQKSFTLGPSNNNSNGHGSRPTTATTAVGQTESSNESRARSFLADLHQLAQTSSTTNGINTNERETRSYVLLRRADQMEIRPILFQSGNSTPTTTSTNSSTTTAFQLLLTIFKQDRQPLIISQSYALLLVCGGLFRSDDEAREYVTTKKKDPASTSSVTVVSASTLPLWRQLWKWNPELSLAPSLCLSNLSALFHPLLLSVHPTERALSSILLKSDSRRAQASLEQMWTSGCEMILAILQLKSSPQLSSITFKSFNLSQAFGAYVTASLQQPPLLTSSQSAIWRMIELSFDLFFITPELDFKDAPLNKILSGCFKEICQATASTCQCGAAASSTSSTSTSSLIDHTSFDPYLASSSTAAYPYLSLNSLLLRFIRILIDDPTRQSEVNKLWETVPILHVLLFHIFIFHEQPHPQSESTSKSPLVQDAEYLFTRYWFDQKQIGKLLTIFIPVASSTPFVSSLAIYLPPSSEQFLQARSCAHFSYQREGLNSRLLFHLPRPPSNSTHPISSLVPSSHSHHLLVVILNLLKKYLLLGSDLSSSSIPAASGSTVRVVRDMQNEKQSVTILSTLSRYLNTIPLASQHDLHSCIIQTTFLEYYLWQVQRMIRVKEIFEFAHQLQKVQATEVTSTPGVDILYTIGIRVLLCLIDMITSTLQTADTNASSNSSTPSFVDSLSGASSSSLASPRASSASTSFHPTTTTSTNHSMTTFFTEHIACLLQDITSVIDSGRSFGLISAVSDSSTTTSSLQIADVFDLTYRTPQLELPRIYHTHQYSGILIQVHSFLQSVAQRFNPLQVTSIPSLTVTTATPVKPSLPQPMVPLTSPTRRHHRPFSSHASRTTTSAATSTPTPPPPVLTPLMKPIAPASSPIATHAPLPPRIPTTGPMLEPISKGVRTRTYKPAGTGSAPPSK